MTSHDAQVLAQRLDRLKETYAPGAVAAGKSRHNAALGWVIDAVAAGLPPERILSDMSGFFLSSGREAGPGEIERMLVKAQQGLAEGSLGVGMQTLEGPSDLQALAQAGAADADLVASLNPPAPAPSTTQAKPDKPDKPDKTRSKPIQPDPGPDDGAPGPSPDLAWSENGATNAVTLLATGWSWSGSPQVRTLLRWREQDFAWAADRRHWVQLGKGVLEGMVQRMLTGTGLKQHHITQSASALGRLVTVSDAKMDTDCLLTWLRPSRDGEAPGGHVDWVPSAANPPRWVAFANGDLDLDAWMADPRAPVRAPTPNWFTLGRLDFPWDPLAGCPRFLRFLADSWPGALAEFQVPLLQEWVGYCLWSAFPWHRFLVLQGQPRSGKSTIVQLLEALVGSRYFASLSTSGLASQFGLQSLVGKHLAVMPDTNDLASKRGGVTADTVIDRIKAITGGDNLFIDRKHIDPVSSALNCRLMLVSNQLPGFIDASTALFRRMLLLVFPRTFREQGDQDAHRRDADGIQDPDALPIMRTELAGIARWGLEGLRRLMAQKGRFSPMAPEALTAVALASAAGAPLLSFSRECLVFDCHDPVSMPRSCSISELILVYRTHCDEVGRQPMSRDRLLAGLLEIGQYRRIRPNVNSVRGEGRQERLEGLGLTEYGEMYLTRGKGPAA